MSALTRMERMDELFPEMFRWFSRPSRLATGLPDEIRVDVSENDKEYLVSAEIPGARKEDIRVVVDGNYVSISASVDKEVEDHHAQGGRSLLKETYHGAVQRAFTLDREVDRDTASAKFENGVLRLTLPKRGGAAGGRTLAIQ